MGGSQDPETKFYHPLDAHISINRAGIVMQSKRKKEKPKTSKTRMTPRVHNLYSENAPTHTLVLFGHWHMRTLIFVSLASPSLTKCTLPSSKFSAGNHVHYSW